MLITELITRGGATSLSWLGLGYWGLLGKPGGEWIGDVIAGAGDGDLVGEGVGVALTGVDGDTDLLDEAGELVTELAPDEVQPPLNKLSVFLPAIQ